LQIDVCCNIADVASRYQNNHKCSQKYRIFPVTAATREKGEREREGGERREGREIESDVYKPQAHRFMVKYYS